jgi:5-methyltetrahydropteroyltriglutamate--homocysteine methyltransferase
MTERTTPPFRADHVGSLLRPASLLDTRERFARGEVTAEELRAVEDDAIRDVVQLQEQVGLKLATDGEFRRESWNMDFLFALGGVSRDEQDRQIDWHRRGETLHAEFPAVKVDGPVHLDHTIFGDHFTFLQSVTGTALPKLSIPSPNMLRSLQRTRDEMGIGPYADQAAFWDDVTATYQAEIRAVHDLGCRYLQIDDTSFAMFSDPRRRESLEAHGVDPDQAPLDHIATMNAVLAGRPDDLVITTHTCRGNFRSRWGAEGSYDLVAEALFSELDVDGFFLEYDDERSGGFEPLRFVPKGKVVVLGLVTTKRPDLESADTLKRRIEEASKFLDLDQLALSPQCGFASRFEGNEVTLDDERAKLRLVVETAADVWGEP